MHSKDKIPFHQQRTGRIASLSEFQLRAEEYDELQTVHENVREKFDVELSEDGDIRNSNMFNASERSSIPFYSLDMSVRKKNNRYYTLQPKKSHKWGRVKRQVRLVLFLLLLGFIAAPLNFGLKRLSKLLLDFRLQYSEEAGDFGFLVWAAHTVVVLVCASYWTIRICVSAQGSGIPQMKTVLTGVDPEFYLPGFFKLETLVAKMGGLVLAIGSGLVVGTEGAFVHMMSIIATHLMRLSPFKEFGSQLFARLQILAAACALGVATNFASPIGGVLFSIEVTATYYMVSNYWKAFVSSVGASASVLAIQALISVKVSIKGKDLAIFATDLMPTPFSVWELAAYSLLGISMGIVGGIEVTLIKSIANYRSKLYAKSSKWIAYLRWIDLILVGLATAIITWWPGPMMRRHISDDINDFFSSDILPPVWHDLYSLFGSLSIFCIGHWALLPFAVSLRIPTGAWIPMFSSGAAFGRLIGETLHYAMPEAKIVPATYAIVGAASLAGSVTQTVSAAVIAMEVTGQLRLLVPIFFGVLFSIGTSKIIGHSVYDALLVVRGLPFMPWVKFCNQASVRDAMDTRIVYLTKTTTIVKVLLAVYRIPGHEVPVVSDDSSMQLLGTVHTQKLKELVRAFYQEYNLGQADDDVGEPTVVKSGFTFHSFRSIFKRSTPSTTASFDHLQTITRRNSSNQIPIFMDDERMQEMLMQPWDEQKRIVLQQKIPICYMSICKIHPMSLTVSSATTLDDVHVLFTMLRQDHFYITDHGRLSGVLTTNHMLEAHKNLD